jgi:hypothetical protein
MIIFWNTKKYNLDILKTRSTCAQVHQTCSRYFRCLVGTTPSTRAKVGVVLPSESLYHMRGWHVPLIILTCHKKFLSHSYHQNVHHNIIIISHQQSQPRKHAAPAPQCPRAPLHIVVVLGQVDPEPQGPMVVPHANKVGALGLVVDKVA